MPLGIPPPSVGLTSGSPNEILLGTGTSVPAGLEAILEFNGLYLNDRANIDTYIINNISGLDDAELRDDREVNPQSHGETAFDAYYGGRTITLSGYVRAFTLNKLRDMQQGLKQALTPLTEMPLVFHTFGDPLTDSLIYCRKGAPLQMSEVQSVDNVFRRDFMITLRASNPRFFGLFQKEARIELGVVDTFSTDSSASYDKTGATLNITAGKLSPTTTAAARWIRNDLGFEMSDTEVVFRYEPDASMAGWVVGVVRHSDSSNYIYAGIEPGGALTIGKMDGGVGSALATSSAIPTRSAGTAYWVRVRVTTSTILVEHFTTDPRITESGLNRTLSHTLAGANAIKFGNGITGDAGIYIAPGSTAWRVDDLSITPYNFDDAIMSAPNSGNFSAQPEVKFTGPMTYPILTNIQNGQSLAIDDTITTENPYTVDTPNRVMMDSAGVNKFSKLTFNSDWLELEPGDNQLMLNAQEMSPVNAAGIWYVPEVSVVYRDAWI